MIFTETLPGLEAIMRTPEEQPRPPVDTLTTWPTSSEDDMDARRYRPQAGDIVEVNGHRVGDVKRLAEVLEVLGEPDHLHYHVRWEDGHDSIYFPGSDAIIRPRHLAHSTPRSATSSGTR